MHRKAACTMPISSSRHSTWITIQHTMQEGRKRERGLDFLAKRGIGLKGLDNLAEFASGIRMIIHPRPEWVTEGVVVVMAVLTIPASLLT